jgi:hypothetical protein
MRRGAVALLCISGAYWLSANWWPQPAKPNVNGYYKEARRKPKPGCHQRRMMHEHSKDDGKKSNEDK